MNKKIILLVSGLLVLLLVPLVMWGITSYSERGTEKVSLLTVPSNATVKVNDKEYTGKKSIQLSPGTYTVTVSKEGFAADTQQLIVNKSEETTLISLLNPVSDEAKAWVRNNQSAYLEAEGKASALATQQGEALTKKYPITKWLPRQKSTFVIGYKQAEDSTKGIIVTITATEGFREAALQEIRDRGFDPSDYTIEFNEYRNPFNE